MGIFLFALFALILLGVAYGVDPLAIFLIGPLPLTLLALVVGGIVLWLGSRNERE